MRSRRRKRVITPPEIMLSPMIDMIFLLLVFFIVSTMYMSEIKTIPIRLPAAQNAETRERQPSKVDSSISPIFAESFTDSSEKQ